ncbi:hypothetical protein [Marinobacter caseinilyticus]|uniref:hypothetical protein n=1 Tax=Marinobacter caseinilyticus TaxID=2692195 RepID=UPI001409A3E1|nr:hypothetical protein [Marinobacter caseinilyticus]
MHSPLYLFTHPSHLTYQIGVGARLLGLSLMAGLLAGIGDGTFCFLLDDQLGLTLVHPRLADFGPGLVFGVVAFITFRVAGLHPTRSTLVAFTGTLAGITLGWIVAYALGLTALPMSGVSKLFFLAFAGACGGMTLALVLYQFWQWPAGLTATLLVLAVSGALFATVQPALTAIIRDVFAITENSPLLWQRVVGNVAFFSPWQGIMLLVVLSLAHPGLNRRLAPA